MSYAHRASDPRLDDLASLAQAKDEADEWIHDAYQALGNALKSLRQAESNDAHLIKEALDNLRLYQELAA